jgi:cytochrome bd-type quinol oxidase subunit 2
MRRPFIGSVLVVLMLGVAVPVAAEERSTEGIVAPASAVAAAWTKDDASRSSSKTIKALYGSYGVLQGLDMYSTIAARQRGAVEANPLMNTGFTHGAAFKALMGATTMLTVKAIEKKNKKAAIVTMIALNSVTAIVVANNIRNARRLR